MINVWRKENQPASTSSGFVTAPKGLCCFADVLIEFVGPLAIYGDVNDILEASMSRMKDFVETTNLKKLQASRQAERKTAEREQAKKQKQLHKVHGSGAAMSDACAQAAIAVTKALVLVWRHGSQKRKELKRLHLTALKRSQISYCYICIKIYIILGCPIPLLSP